MPKTPPARRPWAAAIAPAYRRMKERSICSRARAKFLASICAAAVQEEENRKKDGSIALKLVDNDDVASVSSDGSACSVESGAPLEAHINNASARTWGVAHLRPMQMVACMRILFDLTCAGKLMVVDRTGGGKSHIIRMIATLVGGVHLVIVPLLSLTADQMTKMKEARQKHSSIETHHLDEIPPASSALREKIIPRMKAIGPKSSSSMVLFCSPQYLAENKAFRAAVLSCHSRKTLRSVTIDEVHLFAMHGRSFRESIRMLATVFFPLVFSAKAGTYHPLFLLMTATMTTALISTITKLTGVDWNCKERQLWASAYHFRQRNIFMDFEVTGDVGQRGIPRIVQIMKESASACACIFVNFRSECAKWMGVIEGQLDKAFLSMDVLQINGDMDKNEKFWFTRLFTNAIRMRNFDPRILVATAAANTGIDNRELVDVLRVGLPRDILTGLQERGRNARQPGMFGAYRVFTDFKMFVKLLLSILLPLESNVVEPAEYEGANSVIKAKFTRESPVERKEYAAAKYQLSDAEKLRLRKEDYSQLIDVLKLYCLNLGCIHCRCEWFLASGALIRPPENLPCETQCFICTEKYKKYFLPVRRAGVEAFFKSSRFCDAMPMAITVEDWDGLLRLLYGDADWCMHIFGRMKVQKYNVAAFFLQLIAAHILSFERRANKEIVCILARDDADQPVYLRDPQWEGIAEKQN